jgi:hypothetical protein
MPTLKKPRRRKAAGKGPGFERHICKLLSLWVSGNKDADLFWRSAISGGRATQSAKRGQLLTRQAGDICSIGPAGHALTDRFFIECKHRKDLNIQSFLLGGKTGSMAKFWRKACKEAKQHGKTPLMIAKQNNTPTLVITPANCLPCETLATVHGPRCDISLLGDMLAMPFDPEAMECGSS